MEKISRKVHNRTKLLSAFDFTKKEIWSRCFFNFDTQAFEQALRTEKADFWMQAGSLRALRIFHESARRVPAYKDFLRKHKIRHERIRSMADFAHVPLTDKRNYINAYSLKERSWDGKIEAKLAAVSSGTTGEPTFWPRGSYQEYEASIIHELIYRYSFDIDKYRTLLIIGFPMGVYVSGVATLLPSILVSDKPEYHMTIVSAGNNKAEILRSIKNLQGEYEQIVLVGHPFFIKDVVETGKQEGIRWSKTRLRFMFCSEGFNETWRKYVIQTAGQDNHLRTAVSTYGSSELLLMAWETPLSIYIRELMQKSADFKKHITNTRWIPSVFQYNPLMRWIESVHDSLVFTSASGLPLIRYDLHDSGDILPFDTATKALNAYSKTWQREIDHDDSKNFIWKLPLLKLGGRTDQTLIFYAANIYPEHIHAALNHKLFLQKITGKFVMHKHYLKNMDEYFEINIELRPGILASKIFARELQRHITAKLKEINMEYLFITTHNKKDLRPHIALRPYQDEKYFKIGTKPKYIANDSQVKLSAPTRT